MTLRLSFRKKVVVAIVLTVGGMVALGTVAAPALSQLAAGVSRAGGLTRATNRVTAIQIETLDLMDAARRLQADRADAFLERVRAFDSKGRSALEEAEAAASDPQVRKALGRVAEVFHEYTAGLEQWVALRKELGFTGSDGLRAEAGRAGEAAVKALSWMSVLKNPLLEARDALKEFFLNGDERFAAQFREKIAAVRQKMKDLGMENTKGPDGKPLGATLAAYEKAALAAVDLSLEATKREQDLLAALDRLNGAARQARSVAESVVEAAQDELLGMSRRTVAILAAGGTALAVVLVALQAWIGVTTVRRLNRTADLLKDMALGDGDLTKKLPQRFVVCSDIMNCSDSECPSYGIADPCWSQVGSLQLGTDTYRCTQLNDGTVSDCESCPVYQTTRSHEVDEFDRMSHWFNLFVDRVRHVVRRAAEASQALAQVADQVSSTTAQIATSNEQVSSQSQAVATAGEEMSATVQTVAMNTAEVNEAAEGARRTATEGAGVVSRAVEAMLEIAHVVEQAAATVKTLGNRTDEIGSVIQVIEDIADQTNLLALNAAIEAARAGEHGRGFAVVADEVRKLAEKTVKATREIGETIDAIQAESRNAVRAMDEGLESVAQGRELGEQAGEAIRKIEDEIGRAASQTEQIAAATEQLSATIQEVATNIEEIARGVAQNSQATTALAETADSLAAQARELQKITGSFRT